MFPEPESPRNPDKECFEIGQWDEDGDHSTPLQTFIQEAAQWPDFDGPDFTPLGGMSSIQFREIVRRQFEVYFAAARQLLELICIGLDIDQSKFDNLLENHASTFRLIHNPPRHDIIPEGMSKFYCTLLQFWKTPSDDYSGSATWEKSSEGANLGFYPPAFRVQTEGWRRYQCWRTP